MSGKTLQSKPAKRRLMPVAGCSAHVEQRRKIRGRMKIKSDLDVAIEHALQSEETTVSSIALIARGRAGR